MKIIEHIALKSDYKHYQIDTKHPTLEKTLNVDKTFTRESI